ncbi:tail fiber assembly protein [Erwinia tracheiphila]|uniref:Tail assembly protein n=1 Tax=Erwinia tracheiphila TaxID=65700 RepID=A0A0M2KKD3_9GAMM|nr:tail fiber assembly protein [Erwinia tracheiphila]EOS94153.1 tail fiber assembly protein [Erwinia tracheiphila PSU-1]KKF35703.1 tail assembly protein [Erwinia tracheiphila]KKF36649.1 tail assembly protein [Erwinia tracheiphila]KKF37698.1 tail assembly protein [Erwinia tracheiphila]UIA87987.1 tail fiber assembly protein [Erwinia tracheiphila]
MATAKLNSELISIEAGDITVFNYAGGTREYLSTSVEYLAPGVGVPANSCTDAPGKSKDGFTICRTVDFTAWEYVADHRGETVYNIKTGEEVAVTVPGDYPEGTTTLAPATPYDRWNGSEWITDYETQHIADVKAAEQQKAVLLAEAQATISLWQTELQLGIISDEDKASLVVWLRYIKAVQAVDTSKAPDIIWPVRPV